MALFVCGGQYVRICRTHINRRPHLHELLCLQFRPGRTERSMIDLNEIIIYDLLIFLLVHVVAPISGRHMSRTNQHRMLAVAQLQLWTVLGAAGQQCPCHRCQGQSMYLSNRACMNRFLLIFTFLLLWILSTCINTMILSLWCMIHVSVSRVASTPSRTRNSTRTHDVIM